jgi:DNA modification methylase
MTNTLYYGDNLHVLREHIADESVDLVYLDPRAALLYEKDIRPGRDRR